MTFKEKLWVSFWDGPGVILALVLGLGILIGGPAVVIVQGHFLLGITLFALIFILGMWAVAFHEID